MRRSIINGNEDRWRSFFKKPVLWALLWAYLFTLVASLIALSGQNRTRYKVGQVVEETIVARVAFEAVDEEKTARERDQERRALAMPVTEGVTAAAVGGSGNAVNLLARVGVNARKN